MFLCYLTYLSGVVVNTGLTTEIGRISAALGEAVQPLTPLQKKLALLGKILVVFALVACSLMVMVCSG